MPTLDHVLAAIADPTRRAILVRLARTPDRVTGTHVLILRCVPQWARVGAHRGTVSAFVRRARRRPPRVPRSGAGEENRRQDPPGAAGGGTPGPAPHPQPARR